MKPCILILFLGCFFGGKSQNLYFPPTVGSSWDTLAPASLGYCQPKIDSLYTFLEDNSTKAFILLKDGKIVLEKYFGGHTATSPWQWASAGKTITAFMVGIRNKRDICPLPIRLLNTWVKDGPMLRRSRRRKSRCATNLL